MKLVNINELMKLTGLSKSTIERLQKRGELPPRKRVGKSVRWLLSDIEKWLETLPFETHFPKSDSNES